MPWRVAGNRSCDRLQNRLRDEKKKKTLVGRSVGRPVGRSVGRPLGRSVGRSAGRSVGRPVGRSSREPGLRGGAGAPTRPVPPGRLAPPRTPPTNQPAGRSTGRSIGRSVGHVYGGAQRPVQSQSCIPVVARLLPLSTEVAKQYNGGRINRSGTFPNPGGAPAPPGPPGRPADRPTGRPTGRPACSPCAARVRHCCPCSIV